MVFRQLLFIEFSLVHCNYLESFLRKLKCWSILFGIIFVTLLVSSFLIFSIEFCQFQLLCNQKFFLFSILSPNIFSNILKFYPVFYIALLHLLQKVKLRVHGTTLVGFSLYFFNLLINSIFFTYHVTYSMLALSLHLSNTSDILMMSLTNFLLSAFMAAIFLHPRNCSSTSKLKFRQCKRNLLNSLSTHYTHHRLSNKYVPLLRGVFCFWFAFAGA